MRSQLDVRLGELKPQILHLPPDVHSLAAAEEAIELADAYGICNGFPLAESQKITLRGALGERADGSWAASRVGDFGPRQGTGKNDKIAARELAGLILFGEKLIIHTAHEFPTANESFTRLKEVFDNHDDLRRRVAHIYTANGAQSIHLLSGQRIIYKARTGGSGRGFAGADLIVYDEAQHLAREHVAASGPAMLANRNSQTWFAGSGGMQTSELAWAIRREAILGVGGRLAYTEATAQTISVVNGRIVTSFPEHPSDLDAWYRAMPGLGRWVTEETMQALYELLGPELFAREGLCVWDAEPNAEGSIISAEQWKACEEYPPKAIVGRPCLAFDVTPDRAWASIVACGARADGLPQVEVVAHGKGTGWVGKRLRELRAAHRPPMIAVDPSGPAGGLLADLSDLTLELVGTREAVQACGMIFDDVIEGRLRHTGQAELGDAVACADKRPVGDAWLWSRKNSVGVISPLVAGTLALWAHRQQKPVKPRIVDLAAALAAAQAGK